MRLAKVGMMGSCSNDAMTGYSKSELANGLPLVLSMVLDQYPLYGGKGYKIGKIAEKY